MTFYNAILQSDYCENGKDLIATYLMDNFFDENSSLYLYNKNEENRPNVKIILVKYTPFLLSALYIFLTASIVVKFSAGELPEKASFKIASYFLVLEFSP